MYLRSQTRPIAPPENPKPAHHGMTWAEMARKEGHTPKLNRAPLHEDPELHDMPRADLVRLAIKRGAHTIRDIVNMTGASASCVGVYVRKLREGGLVRTRRRGSWHNPMRIYLTKRGMAQGDVE